MYSKNTIVVQNIDQFEWKWSGKISWREDWL